MKTEHTPGPWKLDDEWGIIKHGKTEICALHSGISANARLIASAPELLAALQAVCDAFSTTRDLSESQVAALYRGCESIKSARG